MTKYRTKLRAKLVGETVRGMVLINHPMESGMPKPGARSAMFLHATENLLAVASAYPLYSNTNTTGNCHTEARFIPSNAVP